MRQIPSHFLNQDGGVICTIHLGNRPPGVYELVMYGQHEAHVRPEPAVLEVQVRRFRAAPVGHGNTILCWIYTELSEGQ